MLNWNRIAELQSEIGAETFLEVVEIFLEEVEALIDPYRSGKQPENIAAEMHFLCGSAMNLGFDDFGNLCREVEHAVISNTQAPVDLSLICESYDASKIEFKSWLEKASVA